MDIAVALDGSKRRDLVLYQGDSENITVTVYDKDGDSTPSAKVVTSLALSTCPDGVVTIPVGSTFTVPQDFPRGRYWLTANLDGVRTTLAYGVIRIPGGCYCTGGRFDYGGPYGGWW